MIASLEGVLREKTPTCVIVDVGGVGYQVYVPLSTFAALPDEGKIVRLRIHTHVREDTLQLFGFASVREREIFELLLRTNGVGPRLAQTILSGIEPDELLAALAGGDVTALRRVPGLGPKKAERLVVELRERAAETQLVLERGARAERGSGDGASTGEELPDLALSALLHLGYGRAEALRGIEAAAAELAPDAPIETWLRAALRRLSR